MGKNSTSDSDCPLSCSEVGEDGMDWLVLELIVHLGHFRTDIFVFVFIPDPFYSRSSTVSAFFSLWLWTPAVWFQLLNRLWAPRSSHSKFTQLVVPQRNFLAPLLTSHSPPKTPTSNIMSSEYQTHLHCIQALTGTNYITWSEEMKALFHSKGLWQLMNGKKPCPTTAGPDQTTGTSSRIGQLASWCSTFHLTRESTSEQTRMTPQRLGVHWKRSLSSRRWTATLWHMTSSSAFEMH